ncbi:MAG: Chaperone SurA [Pseudomonadota bacterium]|jgi:peptidyl-prolyl cis-trans isomerase SurA
MLTSRPYSLSAAIGVAVLQIALLAGPAWGAPSEVVLDSVVASVNDQPITLSDVTRRLGRPKPLSPQEAASDSAARQVIDALIFERLIEAEAATRKMTVSDAEVDRYVGEIAKRNGLSIDAFKSALAEERRSFEDYRRQIQTDILRSRLTGSLMQAGVAVTESEVEQYLAEHPEFARAGAKLKLRQIVISPARHSEDEAIRILNEAKARIDSGEDFRGVAAAISEGPERIDGGLIGVVAEKDLSPEIFDAVFSLKGGEVSAITRTAQGFHLFWVDERFNEADSEENSRLLDDVRKTIQEQKTRLKVESYFTTELYKAHSVDRKI